MKGSEDAIERVLAGLRDTDAPAGMERRILDGLEERIAASAPIGWVRLRLLWMVMPRGLGARRSLAWGVAAAGVLVVLFAVPAMRRFGHSAPAQQPRSPSSTRLGSPVSAVNEAESFPRQSRVRPEMKTNVPETGLIRAAVSSESDEEAAMKDMHTASFPAPPMPLTEQERLLLRVVHTGDRVEIAMLDSKQRSLEEMKEKAEYQRFFARPPIEHLITGQTIHEEAVPTSDPAQGKQLEGQQQRSSGDDNKNGNNKNGNDNSRNDGKNKGETE